MESEVNLLCLSQDCCFLSEPAEVETEYLQQNHSVSSKGIHGLSPWTVLLAQIGLSEAVVGIDDCSQGCCVHGILPVLSVGHLACNALQHFRPHEVVTRYDFGT